MKIKWNGETIEVENQIDSKNMFFCVWNDYTIEITREKVGLWGTPKTNAWYVQLNTPNGGYDYDGYFRLSNGQLGGTLRQALQDCFNNIDYPLIKIGDVGDDESEDNI